MPRITSHLWFDTEAREAAAFYAAAFGSASAGHVVTLRNTPSGSVDVVTIDLWGHEFTLISAGPLFQFNPSVSFSVRCDTRAEVDRLWGRLEPGATALMPLGEYPFSERYGWLQDRYGLSWQVSLANAATQRMVPSLLFSGAVCGRAEEAISFYGTVFGRSEIEHVVRYGEDEAPDTPGTIKHAGFTLEGQEFAAMDSARAHDAPFNEAISLMVQCETQGEIDHYWDRLSADPKAEQCGWLKDRFGLSWQIVPAAMNEMLRNGDEAKLARVTEAFLAMKKFDLARLQEAYR